MTHSFSISLARMVRSARTVLLREEYAGARPLINTGALARWDCARSTRELFHQFVTRQKKPLKRLACSHASLHRAEAPVLMRGGWSRCGILGLMVAVIALLCSLSLITCAAFVYETGAEFLTAGDFNGDGVADVLVLDKLTGNARVGYANTSGVLIWSAPLVTGVEDASGCAVGRLLQPTRDRKSTRLNSSHFGT